MTLTDDNCKVVYVSVTSTNSGNSQHVILNLAAKLDTEIYCVWIKPPKSTVARWRIDDEELECKHDELFLGERQLPSLPLKTALLMFHAFLKSSSVPVLLVSLNSIDAELYELFEKTGLVDLFRGIIVGFGYALPIWKEKLVYRVKNEDFTLSALSRDFLGREYTPHVYNIIDNLVTLAELAITISSESQLIEYGKSYEEASAQYWNNSEIYRGLEPLLSIIPEGAIREMARAQISYPVLEEVFRWEGGGGLKKFLPQQLSIRELIAANDHEILVNIISHFSTRQGPY